MSFTPIRKILIANRGEIAVRVIRTCKEMGISTVAVFSEADRTGLHVQMADEAVCIGPAPSSQSYLCMDRILDVASKIGADAVHPGYGFLSENPVFAESCSSRGIIFIGPTSGAIRAMGDKTAARELMLKAGVPMAPGTKNAVTDPVLAAKKASEIGFPILIKAAAGGGGKGMRIVYSAEDFQKSLDAAQREAKSAFGDDRVFVEKYIVEPRHIEFQIAADAHGNVVHLFERECSVQRRHQKVIEEAPSPAMTPELRKMMGDAAIEAARSCDYLGVGTVEFLVDADRNFYFMEMNTRLQVEHPVSEWITGIDLVAEQIRIAEGSPLSFKQSDLIIRGHAIESRIYAEDPYNNFLPDPGTIVQYVMPNGLGVRVDTGVTQNSEVSLHYDPMISKLSTWGATREEAIVRMSRALNEYKIAGLRTTIPFCFWVTQNQYFREGVYSTHFVQDHFKNQLRPELSDATKRAGAIASFLYHDRHTNKVHQLKNPSNGLRSQSSWISRKSFR